MEKSWKNLFDTVPQPLSQVCLTQCHNQSIESICNNVKEAMKSLACLEENKCVCVSLIVDLVIQAAVCSIEFETLQWTFVTYRQRSRNGCLS